MAKVHHTAICAADVEESLRFWRDGLGFVVTMDAEFDGDWPTLFEAGSDRLRSVFLGDPNDPTGGILELVSFADLPDGAVPTVPETGFFLVSVYTDVDAALTRLADLGLGGDPRRISLHGASMAVVRDPDGVRVELIGLPS
jgi:glyoxylase I family protein